MPIWKISIKPHRSRLRSNSLINKPAIPGFGLQATREGVTEMIKRCAEHLDDPEVAQLMDSVNAKLGELAKCGGSTNGHLGLSENVGLIFPMK